MARWPNATSCSATEGCALEVEAVEKMVGAKKIDISEAGLILFP